MANDILAQKRRGKSARGRRGKSARGMGNVIPFPKQCDSPLEGERLEGASYHLQRVFELSELVWEMLERDTGRSRAEMEAETDAMLEERRQRLAAEGNPTPHVRRVRNRYIMRQVGRVLRK